MSSTDASRAEALQALTLKYDLQDLIDIKVGTLDSRLVTRVAPSLPQDDDGEQQPAVQWDRHQQQELDRIPLYLLHNARRKLFAHAAHQQQQATFSSSLARDPPLPAAIRDLPSRQHLEVREGIERQGMENFPDAASDSSGELVWDDCQPGTDRVRHTKPASATGSD